MNRQQRDSYPETETERLEKQIKRNGMTRDAEKKDKEKDDIHKDRQIKRKEEKETGSYGNGQREREMLR